MFPLNTRRFKTNKCVIKYETRIDNYAIFYDYFIAVFNILTISLNFTIEVSINTFFYYIIFSKASERQKSKSVISEIIPDILWY